MTRVISVRTATALNTTVMPFIFIAARERSWVRQKARITQPTMNCSSMLRPVLNRHITTTTRTAIILSIRLFSSSRNNHAHRIDIIGAVLTHLLL